MRLPLLPPSVLDDEQKALYDDIMGVVVEDFGDLVFQRDDGALIGPFNAWLHFPTLGRAAWAFNKAVNENTVLPPAVHELVVLVTAARYGARYEIYGHEYFARRAGMSLEKIATIVGGERPVDLSAEEAVAYDLTAALNHGTPLPETVYQVGIATFGEPGVAEIVFLVGCFHMVAVTLNAFDAPVPGREEQRS